MDAQLMRAIEFEFLGKPYSIPAKRAFQIGEQIEEIISLAEIANWQARPRMFKLARAVSALIRFAGGRITDEAVMDAMMQGDDAEAAQENAMAAISAVVTALTGGGKGDASGPAPEKTTAS